jgi:hypothetical protein
LDTSSWRTNFRRRLALTLGLAALAACSLAARCIENTSVAVDGDGHTHIYGEMHNETRVQGVGIMLRGVLLDEDGNVIASKEAPICPPDSQPGALSVFDIRFDERNLPPHDSFKVNASGGRTRRNELPGAGVQITTSDSVRLPFIPEFPYTGGDVFLRFALSNGSQTTYPAVQGCAAAYSADGDVIAASTGQLGYLDQTGAFVAGTLPPSPRVDFLMYVGQVPENTDHVRGWVWIGRPGDSTSAYQFLMTDAIGVQEFGLP